MSLMKYYINIIEVTEIDMHRLLPSDKADLQPLYYAISSAFDNYRVTLLTH